MADVESRRGHIWVNQGDMSHVLPEHSTGTDRKAQGDERSPRKFLFCLLLRMLRTGTCVQMTVILADDDDDGC